MSRLPPTVVGEAYTNSHTWEVLEDLVEVGNRLAGTEGEKAGAEVVSGAFERAGLRDVRTESFDIDGWWRGSSSVRAAGRTHEEAHDVIALPGTVAGEVEAELLDLGYGLPEAFGPEVEDRVVMVRTDTPEGHRWVHRLEKYVAAAEHGAAGFLFRNHVEGRLPPTGEVGWGNRPAPVPAVGVSRELGARLARHAAGDDPKVRLSVDCRNGPSTSVNVEGALGPETGDAVVVSAHVDAHDIAEGARDNGVGCALVAEVARLLARMEDDLDTEVRFVAFGSEEVGLHGARHFVETNDPDSIRCVLNVDGAGDSRTPEVRSYEFDGVVEAFAAATDDLGVPFEVRGGLGPHTDAWPFAAAGVPAVTAGSVRGESGRGWGHTHADTLDKLDPRDLRDLAVVLAGVTVELARGDRDVPHERPEAVAERVADHTRRELEALGRWPFD